jgi:hypothetical protein
MLSTAEVKARAAKFARDWKDACYERGETQTFYNEFFEVFGMNRRRVASFEEPVRRLGDKRGFLDLFWKGKLLVEQKSAGRSLVKAKEQALEYFPMLRDDDLPRYVLVCDFQNFELYDLDDGTDTKFKLADLAKHVKAFDFLRGLKQHAFKDQDPVNIKAAELVGKLHNALKESDYTGHDLERFLVRLVFCLFADDTGIFEPGIFLDLMEKTREDGSDTGNVINALFEVLNTHETKRQKTLGGDLEQFPFVNGGLFEERLRPVSFNGKMREQLIDACKFDWSPISPAIFGSLFQSVMEAGERRKKGAHYTTERNILKLIRPLFLDGLLAEFAAIKSRKGADRKARLEAFHGKLAGLTFFDPACGCGNFLVIAYRELRLLEIEVLHALHPEGQRVLDVKSLSKLDVDRFYGIELEEFPARIAETALWMMDHIMNNRLSDAFGESYLRIPLKKAPHILNGDALECDWSELLPPQKCSYVFGNPPFIGAKFQSDGQRAQVRRIAALGGSGGTLDYVTAWFLKAGSYIAPKDCAAEIAFVATNSITQGEQVAQLWPLLFLRCGLEIAFAHRTFAWGSDAKGKAHVHVVIIGLVKRTFEPQEKRLFSYDDINGDPVESKHKVLSPYLFDASELRDRHLVVEETGQALSTTKSLGIGSKPIDGGYYIFDKVEMVEFLAAERGAKKFMRPFVGAEDFLSGESRYILDLHRASPNELRVLPKVMERINSVRRYRLGEIPARKSAEKGDTIAKKRGVGTVELAKTPARFHVTVIPDQPYLVFPRHTSERREYAPFGWLEPPTIPGDSSLVMLDADLWDFGLVTSRMHMAWLKYIGGKLKSDYRYSAGIVFNAFPWPDASDVAKEKIRGLAQSVLDARAKHPDATLADLYDVTTMPADLRKAHKKLDEAVDGLYRRGGFESDRERVEHLFSLYEKLATPLTAAAGRMGRKKSVKTKR